MGQIDFIKTELQQENPKRQIDFINRELQHMDTPMGQMDFIKTELQHWNSYWLGGIY